MRVGAEFKFSIPHGRWPWHSGNATSQSVVERVEDHWPPAVSRSKLGTPICPRDRWIFHVRRRVRRNRREQDREKTRLKLLLGGFRASRKDKSCISEAQNEDPNIDRVCLGFIEISKNYLWVFRFRTTVSYYGSGKGLCKIVSVKKKIGNGSFKCTDLYILFRIPVRNKHVASRNNV